MTVKILNFGMQALGGKILGSFLIEKEREE